jgi:hypothetical protein
VAVAAITADEELTEAVAKVTGVAVTARPELRTSVGVDML